MIFARNALLCMLFGAALVGSGFALDRLTRSTDDGGGVPLTELIGYDRTVATDCVSASGMAMIDTGCRFAFSDKVGPRYRITLASGEVIQAAAFDVTIPPTSGPK